MTSEERSKLIERLNRSFIALPRWAKIACKHAMAAPEIDPKTGKEFNTFREVLEAASDQSLLTIKGDFESNEDLAPEEVPPEPVFRKEGINDSVTREWVEWKAGILTHHKEEVREENLWEALRYAAERVSHDFLNPNPDEFCLRAIKEQDHYQFYYGLKEEPQAE